jgi:hypothetical protein
MSTYSITRCTVLMLMGCGGLATAAAAPAADPTSSAKVQATLEANVVSVRVDSRPVLEYQSAASPTKPYVRQLFTPAGVAILRDSAPDHKHHHGLMFAVKAGGVNFWEEAKNSGRQVPQSAPELHTSTLNGDSRASITQQLEWLGPEDRKVLQEQRSIAVLAGPQIPATLVTWHSHLHAPKGPEAVTLKGTHYDGLGMRFVESMDDAGRFFNSEGSEGLKVRGSERVTPARWSAYTSKVGERPVTVALFDHPKNPRPGHFFTMRPFAYLSVTLNVWKQPIELAPDADLDLRYGVALWDGEIAPDQVEKLYSQWKRLER